ncbi:MAG: helix-turn-helix domain-containing protein [Desulfobacterales bacterium]|jgi:transcriptional regulator with XRE-family HTH domain
MDIKEIKAACAAWDPFEDLTGTIPDTEPASPERIGQRIRDLRVEKGLSLDELANMTGFERSLLEGIEAGTVHPQLGTVMRLSRALDSAFGRLVSGKGDRLYSITRRGEHKVVSRSTGMAGKKNLYTYMALASEVKGRHMEALMVRLEENPDEEMSVHDGEEFIYVFDGTVSLTIGGDTFELTPGDSVYYLSTTPHKIAAKEGTATILAVLYGQ